MTTYLVTLKNHSADIYVPWSGVDAHDELAAVETFAERMELPSGNWAAQVRVESTGAHCGDFELEIRTQYHVQRPPSERVRSGWMQEAHGE